MREQRIVGYFALAAGLSILAWWVFGLLSGDISRSGGPELWFHVVAETVTGIALMVAGYRLLERRPRARRLFLVASGMLLYATLNSAGIFMRDRQYLMGALVLAAALGAVMAGIAASRSIEGPHRTTPAEAPGAEGGSD